MDDEHCSEYKQKETSWDKNSPKRNKVQFKSASYLQVFVRLAFTSIRPEKGLVRDVWDI